MRGAGMEPDKGLWNTLLKAHAKLSDVSGARAVMEEMRAAGVQPDAIIKRIVGGWPPRFDCQRTHQLGLRADASYRAVIEQYIEMTGIKRPEGAPRHPS